MKPGVFVDTRSDLTKVGKPRGAVIVQAPSATRLMRTIVADTRFQLAKLPPSKNTN